MIKISLLRTNDDRILSISHETLIKLFALTKIDGNSRLGYNKGRALKVDIKESKTNQYSLILGDSHAFWRSHQNEDGLFYFEQMLKNMEDGDTIQLVVIGVSQFNPQILPQDMEVEIDF